MMSVYSIDLIFVDYGCAIVPAEVLVSTTANITLYKTIHKDTDPEYSIEHAMSTLYIQDSQLHSSTCF